MRLFTFVASTLLFAVVAHFAWSGLIFLYAKTYQYRLPELPKIANDDARADMVAAYLMSDYTGGAIITGSSFVYGYPVREDLIFSRELGMMNISVMDARPSDLIMNIYCTIKRLGIRPDAIILEIPVVNHNSQLLAEYKARIERPLEIDCPGHGATGLYDYFARRPYGIKWISILHKELKEHRERGVQLSELPKDWIPDEASYAAIRNKAKSERLNLVRKMSELTDRLIVFQTPIYVDGMVQLGFSRSNVEKQAKDGISFCRPTTKIQCVDTSELNTRKELYRDVVHLGVEGHKLFGQWLQANISRQ